MILAWSCVPKLVSFISYHFYCWNRDVIYYSAQFSVLLFLILIVMWNQIQCTKQVHQPFSRSKHYLIPWLITRGWFLAAGNSFFSFSRYLLKTPCLLYAYWRRDIHGKQQMPFKKISQVLLFSSWHIIVRSRQFFLAYFNFISEPFIQSQDKVDWSKIHINRASSRFGSCSCTGSVHGASRLFLSCLFWHDDCFHVGPSRTSWWDFELEIIWRVAGDGQPHPEKPNVIDSHWMQSCAGAPPSSLTL